MTTTADMSQMRSTPMVTKAAVGRTRGSRSGKNAGRRISPARPTEKIAPKPTAVAANRSRQRAGASGAISTRQRKARTT